MSPYSVQILGLYKGGPSLINTGHSHVKSGIAKQPVAALEVTPAGVAGDCVANPKYHGGPDQAVYLYTQADADAWAARGLTEGAYFGENVRLAAGGLLSTDVRVGDRFYFGEGPEAAVLEATAPRFPCATAAAYLQQISDYRGPFARDMYEMGTFGIYTRVVQPGQLTLGASGEYRPTAGENAPTLLELAQIHKGKFDVYALQRALAAPLSARMRKELEEKRAKVAATAG